MENDVFLLLFAKSFVVAAVQGQIASMKFARCLRKSFHLRESLIANNAITMIKQSQGEVTI